jgi:dolichol-phosphate mannosyltransferase
VKKLVSICIPAYNESDVIAELAARLSALADSLSERYDFEFIICENGSHDDTYERLLEARKRDERLKIVRLTRNFFAEGGVTAAISLARGDCAIIMNADLQDPPEYVPQLLEKWEQGYQNVYCIVGRRRGESAFRRFLAGRYYAVMNYFSESPAPPNVSDFRLVDRAAYETYLMRYMWPWMGFRSIGIETVRPERAGGRSSFRFWITLHNAARHVFAQSRTPLTVIPTVGLAFAALSFVLLIGEVIRACFFGVPFDGYGTIVALMLLMFGCLFVFLWMIAEYIGMIFEQVRYRPTFIISDLHGLDGRTPSGVVTVSGPLEHDRLPR